MNQCQSLNHRYLYSWKQFFLPALLSKQASPEQVGRARCTCRAGWLQEKQLQSDSFKKKKKKKLIYKQPARFLVFLSTANDN